MIHNLNQIDFINDNDYAFEMEGMDLIDASLDKIGCLERHFVQGNHEVWLDKFVTRYPYLERYMTSSALNLKERGYKFHPYNRKKCLKIGKHYYLIY